MARVISYSDPTTTVDTVVLSGRPQFVVFNRNDATFEIRDSVTLGDDEFEPIAPGSHYLATGSILLPTALDAYGSLTDLVDAIRSYIHTYCDIPSEIERIPVLRALELCVR